jgi:hypothetical protein
LHTNSSSPLGRKRTSTQNYHNIVIINVGQKITIS